MNLLPNIVDMTPDTFTKVKTVDEAKTWIGNNIKSLFFYKRKEWEHEQEYRIMKRFEKEDSEQFLEFQDSLKYIILCNSKNIDRNDTILNSKEYKVLRELLPVRVKILVYSSFCGESSLSCFDDDRDGKQLWGPLVGVFENFQIDI